VLLELARTIVSDSHIQLAAPLVFLLNGGEETFLQVLHRWLQHHVRMSGKAALQG
jgi:hypothetical protein